MTEYQIDPNVCPASLNEDGMPADMGGTAHRWSDTISYNQQGEAEYECDECGATKPIPFKCPICGSEEVIEVEQDGTHIYVCDPCPFVGIEYYDNSNIDALTKYLNRPLPGVCYDEHTEGEYAGVTGKHSHT